MSSKKALHPAEQYVQDVVAGRIVASHLVKLACERHLRDLVEGPKRGLYFDAKAAQRAIDFYSFVNHSKGEWAGTPLTLEPWQQFIVWSVFGWKKKATGMRRFHLAHLEIARGNGKTTFFAGTGLYMLVADGEPGAEIYCVATKKDQAKILFSEAERMVSASPGLKKRVKSFRNNLNIPGTASKFEPLGSDADTMDGLNIHCAIIDEFHEVKKRELFDKLITAMGKRRQPLIAAITTAGYDRDSVCWKQHEYGEKVLEQVHDDDAFFAFIAALDPKDDWEDERNWQKGNPNLHVAVKIEELRDEARRAKQDPSSLNSFLRYRLNMWTSSETAAIKPASWRACVGFPMAGIDAKVLRQRAFEALRGRDCYLAVDLSATEDVSAKMRIFPPASVTDRTFLPNGNDASTWVVLGDYWLPKDNIDKKVQEGRVALDVWVRDGFIHATEGNVIDYDVIEQSVLDDFEQFNVKELTFDPWGGVQFTNDLQKQGIPNEKLVKFPQTVAMFAEPTKRLLEVLIPQHAIAHLGDPVLAWMAANLVVKEDANENRRPVKGSKRGKIDGMVALIMALGRAIAAPSKGPSVYETRGVLTL